jgi:hypothetical protein
MAMKNFTERNLIECWRNLDEAEAASREQALKDIAMLIRRYEINLEEIKALCDWANPESQRYVATQSVRGCNLLFD